jgi:hypothetical protein
MGTYEYNNKSDFSPFHIDTNRVSLPLPPENTEESKFEMEVYARFMKHLRHVPNSGVDIKILSSIQFTADMMNTGDALAAKTLVDLGLLASRKAFPVAFLDFVDKSVARRAWEYGSPPLSILALKEHWDRIGENRFQGNLRSQYAVFNESVFETM